VRMLRSASRIRTCRRSTISGASFLDLSSCKIDVGLEAPDHWRIFMVVSDSESGSQIGLRSVVNFKSIMLEVPEEISRT
jgi:hypothetical protein